MLFVLSVTQGPVYVARLTQGRPPAHGLLLRPAPSSRPRRVQRGCPSIRPGVQGSARLGRPLPYHEAAAARQYSQLSHGERAESGVGCTPS